MSWLLDTDVICQPAKRNGELAWSLGSSKNGTAVTPAQSSLRNWLIGYAQKMDRSVKIFSRGSRG
jgi:hypothetical protein